jgi:hypothetical protein
VATTPRGDGNPVTQLHTDKVDATRTISTTAPLTGGGDLSANRTLGITTGTTAGTVALGDHTHSALPAGVIARYARTSNATITSGAAEMRVLWLSTSLIAGRLYRISGPSLGIYGSIGGASVYAQVNIRYTTNGTVPTTSSTQLAQAVLPIPAAGVGYSINVQGYYTPGSNIADFRAMLSYTGSSGNNATMQGGAAYPIPLVVEDMGVDPGSAGTNLNN